MANVEFLCADAGQAARQLGQRGRPAGGAGRRPAAQGAGRARAGRDPQNCCPPRVVYVSCDPATLARDVAELCGAGYALERAQAFDLFPRTSHVETAALLVYRG